MDKKIIAVWDARLRHQSPIKVVILSDLNVLILQKYMRTRDRSEKNRGFALLIFQVYKLQWGQMMVVAS